MEKVQKSLKLNFIMNTLLTMSSFVFPLITFPYASRVLLPVGVGKVTFATSLISYFNMFAQLGIPIYGIRACAVVRDDREALSGTVWELFFINLLTNIVTYAFFVIALAGVPRLRQEKPLFLILSLMMWFQTIGMEWLYKALEKYTYITLRSVMFKLIAVIAMFLLVRQQSDYLYYGGVTILAAAASNIFNFINLHRYVDIRIRRLGNWKRHVKPVLIFFAMSCATTIYTSMDAVMLGFVQSDTEVGYYGVAVKVKEILVCMVTSAGTVLLPRLSYYIENGKRDEFYRIMEKAFNFVLMVSVPLCIYFILFAKESIDFLSGDAYAGAVLPMQVIMPTLILIGLTNIMGMQMMVPVGKEKYVLYSEIAGAVVNFFLNLFLIPHFASAGAAFGTLVAEAAVCLVQCYVLRDDAKGMFHKVNYGLFCCAALLSGIAVLWVKKMDMHMFSILAVSASFYFGIYVFILLMKRELLVCEMASKIWKMILRKH